MIRKSLMRSFAAGVLLLFLNILAGCSQQERKEEVPVAKRDTIKRRDPHNYMSDCRDLYNKALQIDSILQQQVEAEASLGNKAIAAFTDYAYYCDNDSTSAIYLIKTAQVARAIRNIPQAEKALQ